MRQTDEQREALKRARQGETNTGNAQADKAAAWDSPEFMERGQGGKISSATNTMKPVADTARIIAPQAGAFFEGFGKAIDVVAGVAESVSPESFGGGSGKGGRADSFEYDKETQQERAARLATEKAIRQEGMTAREKADDNQRQRDMEFARQRGELTRSPSMVESEEQSTETFPSQVPSQTAPSEPAYVSGDLFSIFMLPVRIIESLMKGRQ